MVQHCVNAANTDFGNYHPKKQCNAADVVGNKSPVMDNSLYQHIRTLGSMQAGSVDFVSNVLPNQTHSYSTKTNTTASSSSSSGYESISSKSSKSLFNRLKRLIHFPPTRKSFDYQMSSNEQKHSAYSPKLSLQDNRKKPSKKLLSTTNQHIPFLYGLKNCGNTCYINAILQCLCHTEQIASYILTRTYEIDMRNRKNNAVNENVSHFKITKIFIQLFQTLWFNSSNTTTKFLYDFKSLLANLNKQYSGNEQNDAQEFLLFLINTIHDELNLATSQRSRQLIQTSTDLAEQAWMEYINLNQSLIASTFTGQLHSNLICHHCQQESQTFEPYLLLSLPIPQKIIKSIFITVVFLNQSPKQLQIGLCLPMNSTVKDVRETIAQQSNLDFHDIALMEIHQQNGFAQVFHDSEPITRLNQDLYAIQFPSSETTEQISSTTDTSTPSFVNLLILNRVRYATGSTARFGAPIAVRVPRQSTYRSLQLSIIKAQHSSIRDQTIDYAQDYVVFQMTLVDQYQTTSPKPESSIVHDVQWPLYFNKIDEILDTYVGQELGPSHIQIYANWHEKYLVEFLSKWSTNDDKPDIHQSVAQARTTLLHQPTSSLISLADCFSLFTQTECLNYDDAWMCTHCRRKENGTVKKLQIWTTPPILIIHLKRFCQTKLSNVKLTYPIDFPLNDFHVKKVLSTKDNEENEHETNSYGLYDLFAVCNHRGSMSNGHYTSFCKNPITEKWFCYDDHLVTEIEPSRVCTPDAYILFYKRRHTPPSSSVSSSEQQIDSIETDLNEQLNIDDEETKPQPLPRRILPQRPSIPPCPLPRTRIPSTEPMNNPWNRFNNHRYSNDEPESNVVYSNSTTLR